MGRPTTTCAFHAAAASLATLLLAVSGAAALAQGATGGPPPGPRERGGMSIGGQISGRMNLIGPSRTDPTPSTATGSLAPPSMFAPDRLDRRGPTGLEGMKLPKFGPPATARPIAPADPGLPPAMDAALPPAALPIPIAKQPLTLTAVFDGGQSKVPGGVKWRVFTDQPDANGEHLMVAESNEAQPQFELDPGSYIVHAVYGLVSTAKLVTVPPSRPSAQTLILKAGGVRLAAFVGETKPPEGAVSFTLSRDDGGVTRTVADQVKAGELLRLPSGAYHVISNWGDANAVVEVDLQVAAGKLTDAQVHHRAAPVTLKLVDRPGGSELANTSWTILTPGGDVIRESIGQLPPVVLSEGDYVAIARREGKTYQQPFEVRAGFDATVEIEGG